MLTSRWNKLIIRLEFRKINANVGVFFPSSGTGSGLSCLFSANQNSSNFAATTLSRTHCLTKGKLQRVVQLNLHCFPAADKWGFPEKNGPRTAPTLTPLLHWTEVTSRITADPSTMWDRAPSLTPSAIIIISRRGSGPFALQSAKSRTLYRREIGACIHYTAGLHWSLWRRHRLQHIAI